MDNPHPHADPAFDPPVELGLQQFTPSQVSHAFAGSTTTRADLDNYDIAVVLQAVYEWGGYRYTNASDAVAAAKRGRK